MAFPARSASWLLVASLSGCAGPADEAGSDATSTWSADDALPVPEPGAGFQLHFGPEDLDDPASVEPFLLAPGGEGVVCAHARAPNEADAFFGGYEVLQREGAHHLLVSGGPPGAPSGAPFDCTFGGSSELFLNVQGALGPGTTLFVQPEPGGVAPENVGLAHRMPALRELELQGHFVNTTDAPLLREVWVNFRFVDPDEVRVVAAPFRFFAGTGVPIRPRSRQTVRGTCSPPAGAEDVRLLDVFGHVHAHGRRVSAWHVTPPGASGSPLRTLVYETYEWQELERYSFNSVTRNPPPAFGSGRGGASSGILLVAPGDTLELECEFENDLDVALGFGASAFTAEMCALIGTHAPSAGREWYCETE